MSIMEAEASRKLYYDESEPLPMSPFVCACCRALARPISWCWLFALTLAVPAADSMPDPLRGVFLPPHQYGNRKVTEVLHYGRLAGVNAVVLHVKNPLGNVFWEAQTPLAQEIGAPRKHRSLPVALKRFREAGFWTIAKIDIFQDKRLTQKRPDLAILDRRTGKPWKEPSGLSWANPHHHAVWQYNVDLANELLAMGFDEIQFDYVRFPSDGEVSQALYPEAPEGRNRLETIGAFLQFTRERLQPREATLSVDLFGFVAWKDEDFGVGQRIEEIAPHVDVICPMLYPSHFPRGFLGQSKPSDIPERIMAESMARLESRTSVTLRPWIQGFWYEPEEIMAQWRGAETERQSSWLIWNPAGNYKTSWEALALRHNLTLTPPKYYPNLKDLAQMPPRWLKADERVVHFTDYQKGFSILSLAPPVDAGNFHTLNGVLHTLDDAVADTILQKRGIHLPADASRATKAQQLGRLYLKDLKTSARRIRPKPVYIHWQGQCRFTSQLPPEADAALNDLAEPAFQAALPPKQDSL